MIKKIISIIAIALVAANALHAEESLVAQAAKAYEADKFDVALDLYNQAAATQGTSDALFYNIGNCHYRLGNLGKAIVNYERALRLNPANEEARTNVKFVKEKAGVVDSNEGSYILGWFSEQIESMPTDTWALIAGLSFFLAIVGAMVYVGLNSVMLRKIGFFGGLILLVISIFSLLAAIHTRNLFNHYNYAVVVTPSVTLSTSPRTPKDKSEEAFLLSEGYKVEVLDSVRSESQHWYEVRTDSEHRAWIEAKNIEKI